MSLLTPMGSNDWQRWRDIRLQALAEAPYAYESTLEDWQQAHETRWRARLETVAFNVIATIDGTPCGMVSATAPDEQQAVELISMWVTPDARGKGVGDALIQSVIQWSAEQNASRVILAVREGNTFAIELYRRNGFVDSGLVARTVASAPLERLMVRPNASA